MTFNAETFNAELTASESKLAVFHLEVVPMVDRCAVCGDPVPEGRHVCPLCEDRYAEGKRNDQCMVVDSGNLRRRSVWRVFSRLSKRRQQKQR